MATQNTQFHDPTTDIGSTFGPDEHRAELEQARRLAERYRLEFIDMDTFRIDQDLFRSIPADLMLRYNDVGVPAWEDRTLRALWRLSEPFAAYRLAVGPNTVERDTPRVRAEFDLVAERLADGRRYLCGDRFTAADLTFASLAAAVVIPPEYGTPLPQPDVLPEPVASAVRAMREHPAGAFALRLFREERRAAAA